jgi:predicted small lipoprotein YifL
VSRFLAIALVGATLALSLAACGKRGSPSPPGENTYPRVYPRA